MKPAVSAIFKSFSIKLEGYIPYMYLDVKGLVTTGIGNLIDPVSVALLLPWRSKKDERIVTRNEVEYEWHKIKCMKHLAQAGALAAAKYCALYLREDDIGELVKKQLIRNEMTLKRYFPSFDSYPADAQLAIHSMAWAMGSGWPAKFPNCRTAIVMRDWKKAAEECLMRTTNNAGLVPRNKANVKLFLAAATTTNPGEITADVR